MQTTIARIVKTQTNGPGLRFPVAYAILACGHSGRVAFKPRRLVCYGCGAEHDDPTHGGKPWHAHECGLPRSGSARVAFTPDEHRDEDRVSQVGDAVICEECDHHAAALEKLRALRPGDVQHTRFRPYDSRGGADGAIYVYKRDERSPSGVTLLMSIHATPEVDAICRALRASPLSPTEGLRAR